MKKMRSTTPTTLTLPPFKGAVRRIIIINLAIFFALAVLSFAVPAGAGLIIASLVLTPDRVLHGFIWQLFTYSFVNRDILSTAFSLLFLWYTGSMLEDVRGARWFTQLFYLSSVGGAVLATAFASLPLLTGARVSLFTLTPFASVAGVSAPLFGVLVAFGVLYAEVEILFLFILRMKVKYLIAIYILLDLAYLIFGHNPLAATVEICSGLCGFLYVRYASSRGFGNVLSERYFGMRNDYYRWKRRRAARKFEVYMRKQDGREVRFDNEGRYISPEDERRRDPNDKRWMN